MSTRLQLAEDIRRECRISNEITTTVDQTGEFGKIVHWLDQAYEHVQTLLQDWKFLLVEYSKAITSGTGEYTPTAFGITNLANWITNDIRCYLTSRGVSDESEVYFLSWDQFKRIYQFGSARSQTGRPIHFSIKPDNSIIFYPIPDDAYTVVGEYYRTPVDWTEESDPDSEVPIFPARFHKILLWYVVMTFGLDYVQENKVIEGESKYNKLEAKLRIDQGPKLTWGPPLA